MTTAVRTTATSIDSTRMNLSTVVQLVERIFLSVHADMKHNSFLLPIHAYKPILQPLIVSSVVVK